MVHISFSREEGLNIQDVRKVAVIGVGGVGSWVAYLLAVSGHVKEMYLFDPDVVEDSNLHRTPYSKHDVGMYKVYALAKAIHMLGRSVKLYPIPERATKDTVPEDVLVLDCRDVVDDLSELSDIVVGYDGTKLSVHVNPMGGTVVDVDGRHGYIVQSYIVPPVLAASIIVEWVLRGYKSDTEIVTNFNMEQFMKYVSGVKHG